MVNQLTFCKKINAVGPTYELRNAGIIVVFFSKTQQ